MIKPEARIVGIDDGPFNKFKDKKVLVVATFFRGGSFMDGVMSTIVTVDGSDSTEKIARMINKSKFKPQLRAIFLHGISVAGFNVIDVPRLSKQTKIPVMVVVRNYPDFESIFSALKKLKYYAKAKLVKKMPRPVKLNDIYVQLAGITLQEAKEFLDITCTRSYIPEPLRVAHIIAAGIIKGESRGRA